MNTNRTRHFIMTMLKVIAVTVTVFVVWMDAQGVVEKPIEQGPSKSQVAMEKAMAKCKPVPEGQFPTAAVVHLNGSLPEYETAPGMVSYLFNVAVGEVDQNPEIRDFTLCR